MCVEQMKDWIVNGRKQGPSTVTWKERVRKMADDQVIAIYNRMLRAGELKR